MTKELSLPQQIAIMTLLSQTMDSWLKKVANFRIPSKEWDEFKKNIDDFTHYPSIFPFTLPDGQKFHIGIINYHQVGMCFVAGSRTDSFYIVYSLSVKIDSSIKTNDYQENSFKLTRLIDERLEEEAEKKLLKAVRMYPEADKTWKWKNGLPKAMNKKEWMLRLYYDSWEAVKELPFATEVEKCTKLFNSVKGDNSKIPCLYGDQRFQIYESQLRFGSFLRFSGNISIHVEKEMEAEMKSFAEEFKKKYEFYLANTAKKQLIGLLPKVENPVSM